MLMLSGGAGTTSGGCSVLVKPTASLPAPSPLSNGPDNEWQGAGDR